MIMSMGGLSREAKPPGRPGKAQATLFAGAGFEKGTVAPEDSSGQKGCTPELRKSEHPPEDALTFSTGEAQMDWP